jgi:ADP-ribose pyrophosphatase
MAIVKKHGPWKINETTLKYKSDLIEVFEDQVIRPDGKPGSYTTICLKAGVCVLPMGEDGWVYLTSQFRYALGAISLEGVTGAIDDGENPEDAARRELREELGIEAGSLVDLGRNQIETSSLKAPVNFFTAHKLTFTEPDQEVGERIRMVKLRFDDAIRAVMDGEIVHASSCLLILKAARSLRHQ